MIPRKKKRLIEDMHLPDRLGLLVIGLRSASGEHTFNPHGETIVEAGDSLIVIGQKKNIAELLQEAE